jgi:hypothetical protein
MVQLIFHLLLLHTSPKTDLKKSLFDVLILFFPWLD